jgi:hypothetical protein
MPKRILQGVVTSDKNDQTITVSARLVAPTILCASLPTGGNDRRAALAVRWFSHSNGPFRGSADSRRRGP